MKIERISFRTTAEEQLVLERVINRFQCRTVTQLMHTLLADYARIYTSLSETTNSADMVAFQHNGTKWSTPDTIDGTSGTQSLHGRSITLSDTRIQAAGINQRSDQIAVTNDSPITKPPVTKYDPIAELIADIEEYEKLGIVINRSLRKHNRL